MTDLDCDLDDRKSPRRRRFWRLRNDARITTQPWRWPLSRLGNRDPLVLAEHLDRERLGVLLGYEPRPFDGQLFVPVHAAQDGTVALAVETASGCFVNLEHGYQSHSTTYALMSKMFVTAYRGEKNRKRERVRGGDVIGYATKSPITVRFEVWTWNDRDGYAATDPVAHLAERVYPLARSTSVPEKQVA